jgi:hypothetical protein
MQFPFALHAAPNYVANFSLAPSFLLAAASKEEDVSSSSFKLAKRSQNSNES